MPDAAFADRYCEGISMDNKPNIVIIYDEGAFSEEEHGQFLQAFSNNVLSAQMLTRSPYVYASLDFFVPSVEILLSPEIVQAIYCNLAAAAIITSLKVMLKLIWKQFHKKPFYKVTNHKITESDPNIQFSVGKNIMVLPVDVDQEKYEYAVDRFFEIASKGEPCEPVYTYYIEAMNDVESKTENQIIAEEVRKGLERSHKNEQREND